MGTTKITPATREQALKMLADGYSERHVAGILGISRTSVWTIKQAAKAVAEANDLGPKS